MHKALAVPLLLGAAAVAGMVQVGPQVVTFHSDVDDSDQPYALYVPKSYNPGTKYPLVISLHDAQSNHRINLRRVFGQGNRPGESDAEASRYFPALRDTEYIVASPFARGTMVYQGIPEKDVYDVLADVKRRFAIDEDRVYLTGLSTGGGGALWLALTRPDIWAAVAPVCATAPPGTEELAPNALNFPVRLFHGSADPAVPVDTSRQWHKRLLNFDVRADYVEYPGVRHNAWDYAYKGGAIFDWFSRFRRTRYPDRVRFISRAYKYNSAYWVKVDALTPGTLASIDARFTGLNRIEITTQNLDGFTLNLAGHPRFAADRPLAINVDGSVLPSGKRRAIHGVVSLARGARGWKIVATVPVAAKHQGAEGPLAEAVAARHLYVYGTADEAEPEETERRRRVARAAAEWSSPRARLALSFPVKADRDVTPKDLADANLILFGTRKTNSLIAHYADRLPLALNPDAADYGLVFIAPVENRYVLINSGLPWWTGADQSGREGLGTAPPFRVLNTLGDYVLFKGSLEDVVAEGRFNRDWKLPADAAARLNSTGTVVVR